jgi:hypothetical protein
MKVILQRPPAHSGLHQIFLTLAGCKPGVNQSGLVSD